MQYRQNMCNLTLYLLKLSNFFSFAMVREFDITPKTVKLVMVIVEVRAILHPLNFSVNAPIEGKCLWLCLGDTYMDLSVCGSVRLPK